MVAFVIGHELGHYSLGHLLNGPSTTPLLLKNQEHCADLFSCHLMTELGFNTLAVIDFLQLLAKSIDIDFESSTHPSIRQRIELIEQFCISRICSS